MNHPALEIDYDPTDELKLRYELLCQQQPQLRARDAARHLNVSEAELVAARANDNTYHLLNRPEALLTALETVGEILVVTRNDSAVLETKCGFKGFTFNTHNGLHTAQCSNSGTDMRMLLNNWRYGFLVIEEQQIGRNKSLQFFDAMGQAVHKIYLTQNSNLQAFAKIIAQFISSEQPTYLDITQEKINEQVMPEQDVQWHKVRKSWQAMQSSHDFFQLLIGSKVTRQQAYDNVGSDLAYEIVPQALQQLFELAIRENRGLTFAVSNKGCTQFHRGPIGKINEHGCWFNVLGDDFNLHINTHRITQAWVVRKPQGGDPITTVEFFDHNDRLTLQVSAEREEGMPEPTHWRELVAQLEPRSLEVSALNTYDAAALPG